MAKPNVLVFSGYGLNCEEETKYAFDTVGGNAEIVHINDLIAGLKKLTNYQILAFPGGFAYGDDTGAGNAYANKVRNHLWKDFEKFLKRDHLIIGICNGFQIIVNLGLLPALNFKYGSREAALLNNATARYVDRWVDLEIQNDSPWLKGIKTLTVPIAHGEGKFYCESKTLTTLKKKNLIALKYTKGVVCDFQSLPANPNGALEDIAGITDESKRILGLMPHPERAMFFTQLPYWTSEKEKLKRTGKQIPSTGPGMELFKNAVRYFA